MKKFFLLALTFIFLSFVSADSLSNSQQQFFSGNYNSQQFTNPTFNNYYSSSDIATFWPSLAQGMNDSKCQEGTDFLVAIPPLGCTPSVVRSDLLEEQNVPVFCQLASIQVNPLIQVSSIKSISFSGKYPADIAGISYHPSRAALRSYNTLLGNPIVNNIGYVVIILKKKNNESSMPKFVEGNLTAHLYYDAQKAFGVGAAQFYLKNFNDEQWQTHWQDNSFWSGRGVLRLTNINGNTATIQVLTNQQQVISSVTLKEGETSNKIYFPGFYCQAGIKIKLNKMTSQEDSALLNIDGDTIQVRRGSTFLEGKCRVSDLQVIAGNTGKVTISCSGTGQFELSLLNAYKSTFKIDESEKEFSLSDKVADETKDGTLTGDSYYLGYAGTLGKTLNVGQDAKLEKDTPLVVLLKGNKKPLNNVYSQIALKISNQFSLGRDLTKDQFEKSISVPGYSPGDIIFLYGKSAGASFGSVPSQKIQFTDLTDSRVTTDATKATDSTKKLSDDQKKIVADYFDKADDSIKQLVENYPQSQDQFSAYGEEGILAEIKLIDDLRGAGVTGYDSRENSLMNQFLELYPNSPSAYQIKQQLNTMSTFDNTNSYKTVYINNDYHSIGVSNFESIDQKEKYFNMFIDDTQAVNEFDSSTELHEEDRIYVSPKSKETSDYFFVKKIDTLSAQLEFYQYSGDGSTIKYNSPVPVNVKFDPTAQDDNRFAFVKRAENLQYKLYISKINVEEVADVSLIPEVNQKSEANFTYKIGIEKRAIQLNPKKAEEKADKLNQTIKDWEEKNAKLGALIEKWKGVCLATGTALQIENLVTGFTGKSLARQSVMTSYRALCQTDKELSNGKQAREVTRDVCYESLSKEINSDVAIYTAAIQSVNKQLEGKTLAQWQSQDENKDAVLDMGNNEKVLAKDLTSLDQVKSYLLYQELKSKGASEYVLKDATSKMLAQLTPVAESEKQSLGIVSLQSQLPIALQKGVGSLERIKPTTYSLNSYSTMKVSDLKNAIKNYGDTLGVAGGPLTSASADDVYGYFITTVAVSGNAAQEVFMLLQKIDSSSLAKVTAVYYITAKDNTQITLGERHDAIGDEITVNAVANGNCNYPYKQGTAEARFYDTAPNQGMPAVVPFDLQGGWYVYVSQVQGNLFSNNVQGYQASGAVQFYYICNVGPNGIEELKGGDDICQSLNANNYNSVPEFSFCSQSGKSLSNLASKAEAAIRQAASQYKNGVTQITINGVGSVKVAPGLNADSSGGLYECQDFMSPDQCKILYNVCDPVICPPSRCNFGGQAHVANVIQSGVIGSTVLCAPNFVGFGGDVAVPVCLTGIHAGIEGFISILKSEQACLKEYAKTGKHVGICDEITSIYKCELFWREAAPLMQNLVPNLAQFIYNGKFSTQSGGGEYLTFQSAWDNMQKSLDYFKNTYASTSFSAFKFGDVQSTGSEFCRAFIGTSIPTSAKAVDSLLKPESPPQFHAIFTEIPFTQATVPATSQYKVTYQIYAGTDQGVSYTVYLKNPPSTSYYYTAQTQFVKSGYIASGQQDSQSIDFTAPAGYKQLCVVINNQEECGFNSVSSNFVVGQLNDLYVNQQAGQNVTTEKECIQGTPSVLPLASISPVSGISQTVNPDISLRGIIRVCSTENPEKGNPTSTNWKPVGYCGDQKLTCWLDLSSVKETTSGVLAATGTVANAQEAISKTGINMGIEVWTNEVSLDKINTLKNYRDNTSVSQDNSKDEIDGKIAGVIELFNEFQIKGYLDSEKAQAYFIQFQLYEKITRALAGAVSSNEKPQAESNNLPDFTGVTASSSTNTQSTSSNSGSSLTTSTSPQFSVDLNNKLLINGATSDYYFKDSGSNVFILYNSQNNILGTLNSRGVFVFQSDVNDLNVAGLQKCTFKIVSNKISISGC